MSEQLLKKAIREKKIGKLYLFYGVEEYLKRNYINYIESNLLPEDMRLLNKVVLEEKITVPTIIDNCETLPIFSDRRLVVVKNSGFFKSKKARSAGKSNQTDDEFIEFLKNVPEHACLIFSETEIDKRIKITTAIKDNGLIVEFDYSRPERLAKWIIKMTKERKHEIDMGTAAMLVEYCESGMDDILNEIDKLCSYAADRQKITPEDIKKVCTKSIKSRIFDLTDAIGRNQKGKALVILDEMIELKEPIPKIIFMIAKQFRQMYQINMLLKQGESTDSIISQLKLHRYFAGKTISQAKMFSAEKLEEAIAAGLELDLSIKKGKLKERAAVELMITGLS